MRRLVSIFAFMLLPGIPHAAESSQNLIDIYRLAVERDPTWSAARNANLAAQEKLEQGKALYRPSVTFNSNANHTESDIRYLGGNNPFRVGGPQSFDTFSYGVNVNQPILRLQNYVQYQQAKVQVSQADKQLLLAQQNLIIRSAQAYFDVLLAQDKIDLINAQKAAIDRQLAQAKANFDVGNATITDVNEAQARYDLIQAQEIAAINELEVKKRTVQSVIGEMPGRLAPARGDLRTTLPEPDNLEKWVALALQNNLNLGIQQQNLEIATQEVDKQSAGHYPTLDAVGSYTDTRAGGGVNGFGNDLESSVIGLQLAIPLYQGGLTSSRVREAVANKQKAFDDVEAARRQADLDTREAYLNLTGSVAQVKAYEQALSSSQSQVDSTTLGYEVGVRNSVDVLNAQQQLFSAKRDLLQARYTYLLSTLKLKSAIGMLSENDLADINQRLVMSSAPAEATGGKPD
ncbi:MAG TPA: TolC family outer membrane protein [Methylophilaceae bacterium]|nr:TolC family outer membrane protein [Methylophilaceae bacterium]